MYEAPKIGDLGQIAEHVFVNGVVFSPEQDENFNGQTPGNATGNLSTSVALPAAGAGMGLAGLGLIGALFAGLAGRSSSENPTSKPPEIPTESGRGEP